MPSMDKPDPGIGGPGGPAIEFGSHRERLEQLARRILGDAGEAEEVVQEAWFRLIRGRPDDVRSMGAWLTTVVTRMCFDAIRARGRQGAGRVPLDVSELNVSDEQAGTPEQQIVLADSVGVALLVVLERLKPAERVAFVLHDVFDMPFEEIAPLIEKSEMAARQLASRARRRVRGLGDAAPGDVVRHSMLAEEFLTAARSGDIAALLRLLVPEVVLRPDATAARLGPGGDTLGAENVAAMFASQGAGGAHVALIDGAVGLIVVPGNRLFLAIRLSFDGDRIAAFEPIADPEALAALELRVPGSNGRQFGSRA